MVAALVAGAAAGYGIAIPVGAIAVLILETGLHRGPRLALFAGSPSQSRLAERPARPGHPHLRPAAAAVAS
ncbi:MAG: lysine transporter LysE, partial [Candidatus Limnocylindrales bacterium]